MYKNKGFTILELLISLSVGLFLFTGVLLVFVGMKATTTQTTSYGNMQETGRVAISMLSDDLMRQGFWGDLVVSLNQSVLSSVPAAPGNECTGEGLNNGTLPLPVGSGHFRTLWGATTTAAVNMGCITNAVVGTDILQLKRVISAPLTNALDNNYYLITSPTEGEVIKGPVANAALPIINNSRIWEYQHHVYFISEDDMGSSANVPVLNLMSLGSNMTSQPLIDGVEQIRFMYGVDTTLDGNANKFLSANNMTQALWDNEVDSRIVAIKIYVLVRDLAKDAKYENKKNYQLGDFVYTVPVNDKNYRRMLFSTTVSLYNGDVKVW